MRKSTVGTMVSVIRQNELRALMVVLRIRHINTQLMPKTISGIEGRDGSECKDWMDEGLLEG